MTGGNLTASLRSQKHIERSEGKSAHQIRAVVDVGVHTALDLMPGYKISYVPKKMAYFAHLRRGGKSPMGWAVKQIGTPLYKESRFHSLVVCGIVCVQ